MSLTRRADQTDTVLAFIDCLYDQALRAQDMRRADRAIEFGEELYRRVPSPQTITALAEAYRLAGRRETFLDFVRSLPPAQRSAPDFGMVLALAARDSGNERLAREILGQVLHAGARPEYARLASLPLARVARDAARGAASKGARGGRRAPAIGWTRERHRRGSEDRETGRGDPARDVSRDGRARRRGPRPRCRGSRRGRRALPRGGSVLGRGVARGAYRGAPEVARSHPRHAARARDSRERERQAPARGRGDRGSLPLRADSGDDEALAPRARRGDPSPASFPHEEDAPRAAPVRRRGRHRPLEFPDPEQRGRCRRAAPGRQHGRAQALRGHPAHVVPAARPLGEARGIRRTSSRSSPGGARRGPRSWTSWTPSCSPAPSRRAGGSPRAAGSG